MESLYAKAIHALAYKMYDRCDMFYCSNDVSNDYIIKQTDVIPNAILKKMQILLMNSAN